MDYEKDKKIQSDTRSLPNLRVGTGFDVHAFAPERDLIIGGVKIPWEMGLLGHSDADVLTHAIMDALLGAAGLPDIGSLFPDTDEKYKGANSLSLLKEVLKRLREDNWEIINVDSTLICQAPKMKPYINEMKSSLAEAMDVDSERINVKATTTEKLGFTGRGEGIAAEAMCLICKVN
ncbi:MAG: 2-C-methyl-D-erythritol 2,4-cyclodiphosphate synthase [Firmicutes bacterium]|nr:2-C-methyl-D-erythritol 2,4-cyclodiphosphate synthase [Bacillota bacterium]